MTTEIELLRKVVEAAEKAAEGFLHAEECSGRPGPLNFLASALAALRAHDAAQEEAGTMEVKINLWQNTNSKEWCPVVAEDDDPNQDAWWRLSAIIVARVPLPGIPTIRADGFSVGKVPEAKGPDFHMPTDDWNFYRNGWNACRAAFLASAGEEGE